MNKLINQGNRRTIENSYSFGNPELRSIIYNLKNKKKISRMTGSASKTEPAHGPADQWRWNAENKQ